MTEPWQPFEPRSWQDLEEQILAPYAMRGRLSRGRRHQDDPHPFRSPYQRDRDRIVHSTAFRRLMYKTQVLVQQSDDHHRTRLTHTLEVAQISRTISRRLGLNEDLTEAIALAHDLGHPPFGHAGEAELDACMANFGGFDPNLHGFPISYFLESRYANFPVSTLSWEVLSRRPGTANAAMPEPASLPGGGPPPWKPRLWMLPTAWLTTRTISTMPCRSV